MSSDGPSSYSDAQSSGGNGNSVVSGDSSGETPTGKAPRPKSKPQSRSLLRSESFFLALLFALVALLLPTFFSFATPPSTDATEGRESPLEMLAPYIPTVTTALRISLSTLQVVLQPFASVLSLILALLAPIFLAVNLLYKTFVVLPSRIVTEVARFLYPIYVFCGVACLFGAGIGIGGRLLIEGSKLLLVQDDPVIRKGKRKIRNT